MDALPLELGAAAVALYRSATEKTAAAPELSYGLHGRLYLSNSGWLLLSVPNALGRGAFSALNEEGVEMPISESLGQYNAHISVMRPEEIESIGGPSRITERGKEFAYTLGPVRVVEPAGWKEFDRCWFIEINSPELQRLRKSYGLSGLPHDGEHEFHITFAVRRRKVLRVSDVTKGNVRISLIHKPNDYLKAALAKVAAAKGVEIKDSPIHGKGLFATKAYNPGDVIVSRLLDAYEGDDGATRYEQSDEARFTNHSTDPNVVVRKEDGYADLIAAREISTGEELLVDYDDVAKTCGPNFYYTYRNKPYGGGRDLDGKPLPGSDGSAGDERDSAGRDKDAAAVRDLPGRDLSPAARLVDLLSATKSAGVGGCLAGPHAGELPGAVSALSRRVVAAVAEGDRGEDRAAGEGLRKKGDAGLLRPATGPVHDRVPRSRVHDLVSRLG